MGIPAAFDSAFRCCKGIGHDSLVSETKIMLYEGWGRLVQQVKKDWVILFSNCNFKTHVRKQQRYQ